jgi:hypothetical protein
MLQGIDQRNGLRRGAPVRTRADRTLGIGGARELAQPIGIARRQLRRIELQIGVENLDLPSQTAVIWTIFSSSVIRARRSSTRASMGALASL